MLTGGKFIPKLHLRQPGFNYSAYGLFAKHREGTQKFKAASVLNYIYENKLDKVCSAYDAAYAK